MKIKCLIVAVACACILAGFSYAQEPQQPSSSAESAAMDIQGSKQYLLGPGDVLDIRVFGQPELSTATAQIDSDGNLSSLPFLEQPIPAKCRTDKQVQKDIAAAYSKFINNPQVSVRIAERNSRQPATIFGAIRQAQRVEMKRKVRLNELIAVSGGFTERASGTIQILHTEPLMCPGPGEEELAKPIENANLPFQVVKISDLRMGKADANPVVRPGDYVLVTEAEPVYIYGAVVAPSGVYLRDQLTLTRALAMVGGTRGEAKLNEVTIYRQVQGTTRPEKIVVDVAKVRKNQQDDPLLQAYDIIEVPEAGLLSKQRFVPTLFGALTGGFSNMVSSTGMYLPNKVIY